MSNMPENRIVKIEEFSPIKDDSINFEIKPTQKFNQKAIKKISEDLPELVEKTKSFGGSNSQHTLSMMSLTMLGGQSPYRLLRQILAETEQRNSALSTVQVEHAKLIRTIEKYEDADDPVDKARYRKAVMDIQRVERSIDGSLKDIAVLIDTYNSIKEKNGIEDWDQESFENEEKRHHVRRGFELCYRNLLVSSRVSVSTIEYMQQFGVHPQVAIQEVSGYLKYVEDRIAQGNLPHANDLEEFLDEMGEKYMQAADLTCERIFGKKDISNVDFMYKVSNRSNY
tara:strand:- start:906 stop:1754 length:849 start_codon:yes stop_codon:yes gene_type:complete